MVRIKKLNLGFTLLETVVALGIIVTTVAGPMSLIVRGVLSSSFSKNKVTAVNLAQEGLELIRQVRENNIICDQLNGPSSWDWFKDPTPPGNPIITAAVEADADATETISCGAQSIITPKLTVYAATKLRFDPTTGFYRYGGAQETIFSRRIDIDQPSADGNIPASEQRDITVTVNWKERGFDKILVLKERMYNWR